MEKTRSALEETSIDDGYVDVTNPLARRFISERTSCRMLLHFVEKETTLAQAADFYKISKQRMSYWINKMLDLRLIKVVRTERAANGSQQAVYTSIAPKLRVRRTDITAAEWRETAALYTKGVWDDALDSAIYASRNSGIDALRIFRDKKTQTIFTYFGRNENMTGESDYCLNTGWARLNEADYRAFQKDIRELVERYTAKKDPTGKGVFYVLCANEIPAES
jgi:hypothetical protein